MASQLWETTKYRAFVMPSDCFWRTELGKSEGSTNSSALARETMPTFRLIAFTLVLALVVPTVALGEKSPGGSDSTASGGGAAQISTWVIGAINGGVHKPAGTTTCTAWRPVTGPLLAGD